MSLSKVRSSLYKTAKFLGDVQAVKSGTLGKRLIRRGTGKILAAFLSRIFR